MNVLVIDDESSVGTLLRFNLRQGGFDVDTAASAAEGFAKARAGHFDLIILDVALPVIMISSRSDSVTIDQARRAGAADYLVKPFTFQELLNRIEDQLSRPYFV
jgi:two-component system alkaline phosphatase synthesis response regulator PhoP